MIIDSSHKPWMVGSAAGLLACLLSYAVFVQGVDSRASGGSRPGLAYGSLGFGMIVVSILLSARKKVPTMRVGRVHAWMKAHVWLGFLSFPLLLLHSAFSLGGPLTTLLMILMTLITFSGVLGMVLQHLLPKFMMNELPAEAIYEQAGEVLTAIRATAAQKVESLSPKGVPVAGYEIVHEFYLKEILPFLEDRSTRGGLLSTPQKAGVVFDRMRKLLQPESQEVMEDLRSLVEQRRQLKLQLRLHHILHGWLMVHVPLSWALLLLGVVHAIMALRYI